MPDGSWALTTGGTWSTAANWTSSVIADGAGFTATFNRNITANRTVTLDTSRSIGTMTSSDITTADFSWIFASSGGSILTLDNGASKPVLSHANGTINSGTPLFAQYNLNLDGTNGFDKQGAGNVLISGVKSVTGTVTITSGQLGLGNILFANGAPAATGNVLPGITSYDLASTSSTLSVCSNTSFTFPSTVTGSGNFLYRANTSGTAVLTCPAGTFSGMSNASATYGVGVAVSTAANGRLDVADFSNKTVFYFNATDVSTAQIVFSNPSDVSTATTLTVVVEGNAQQHSIFFGNFGAGKLTVSGAVNRTGFGGTIFFHFNGGNDLENEISGVIGNAVGSTEIRKQGTGRWVFSGTNTYTGATVLTLGTLILRNASALGSSSATTATTLTAGTLQVQGGVTINKASSAWALNGSTIENVSGDNTITAASWTIATAQTVLVTAGTLTVTNAIAGTSARTLAKTGTGTLKLTSTTSGYLGTVTVSAGTLACQSIANVAVACSLGTQALAQAGISMAGGTTLAHVGTTASSTDRNITCTGAATENCTLDSSGTGSGAITYASGGTLTFNVSGAHTLILSGTNAADNTFARTIADASGGGAVSVSKQGSNTWILTGSLTNSGGFSCNAGTLNFGATNRTLTGGLTVSAGTVSITSPSTIDAPTTLNGGTVTAVLSGGTTITVSASATPGAPATLQPNDATDGSNTFTGAVGVSGCVDLVTPAGLDVTPAGRGRVLGTSNTVTVNSGGILRTKSGTSQAGHARYYNLTLGNGSQVQIGAAA
jgi:fibronectin-binding autotransporter adhesin